MNAINFLENKEEIDLHTKEVAMEIDDECCVRNYDVDNNSNSEDNCDNETMFPLISEPLKTFITINPATLEDEELWPLISLKNLCEFIGLSVKGSRRCILNRLQAWNGAPLSGAGHPDLYDTRSARFHTVPMAYVNSTNEDKDHNEVLGNENENNCLNIKNFHSPILINKVASLNSTPLNVHKKEVKSCLNSCTPKKKESLPRSSGRICFSPYNHVRVFVSNPGERELNVDPDSILRLGDEDDEDDYSYFDRNDQNFWGESNSAFTSKINELV